MGRIHLRKHHNLTLPSQPEVKYTSFDQLDGRHDWQTHVPEACVLYPARKLNVGSVLYFNFDLAKEMGLIDTSHSKKMNPTLEKKILDTFCIRIINEYDQKQNIVYHPAVLKKHKYMATRYLQMQHKDKTGRTSGDGRSIWNGQLSHKGKIWDVSSRGTGVTCLAPGAVEAQKPLRSGSTNFGYGCGLADLEELMATAISAEIFHRKGIVTERMLAIIDTGRGTAIGVRAGVNLFRPAHLFMHLKTGNYETLKKTTDFYINRQNKNGEWKFSSKSKHCYNLMLNEIEESFAKFTAHLDREYIFAWLDWDGDNVLTNGGIIDYGSIRQFGLRHDEYRYDDVERFSTNLNEQRKKARDIIQTFAQLVNFLNTGVKKPYQAFNKHPILKKFDQDFQLQLHKYFLSQIGFEKKSIDTLMSQHKAHVAALYKIHTQLETQKTARKPHKVPDGINRPAIYNMRTILYDLADYYHSQVHSKQKTNCHMPAKDFFKIILADTTKGQDRKLSYSTQRKIARYQKCYFRLLAFAFKGSALPTALENLASHAMDRNRLDRITGDGILYVVDKILREYKKTKSIGRTQSAIEHVILNQSPHNFYEFEKTLIEASEHDLTAKLYRSILALIDGHKESI